MNISPEAIDFIIREEDSDEGYYAKFESGFSWPGGASGPTVGVGYDCGYSSQDEIRRDWDGIVDPAFIDVMAKAAGIRGGSAQGFVAHYRHFINIPWEKAVQQFVTCEVPKWITKVTDILPNCDHLHPHSLGALVSLAYNRGCSFRLAGPRYQEMRNIFEHMVTGRFDLIPQEFIDMRRLWPPHGDLWKRREHEAALFKAGLTANIAPEPAS